MTHQEWVKRVVAREDGLPVPFNAMFTPPALEAAQSHFQTDDIFARLDFPLRFGKPKSIKPLYADDATFGATVIDEFGVRWSTNPIDRGSPVGPCLRAPSLEKYVFPPPEAGYRFEDMAAWSRQHEGRFRVIWIGDLWERATFMRGYGELLLDAALHPQFVRDLLRRLADGILETTRILCDRFAFEAVAISDDYGTQDRLVMSPAMWRDLVAPVLKELLDYGRQRGKLTMLHSCGNVREIVPDLAGMGLDILHPIQPEAMDTAELKREFGRDLSFCGGVSTQRLLVTAGPDEVRAEIRRLKETLGRGGGYILEPAITLQADVPAANLVAFLEEAVAGAGSA